MVFMTAPTTDSAGSLPTTARAVGGAGVADMVSALALDTVDVSTSIVGPICYKSGCICLYWRKIIHHSSITHASASAFADSTDFMRLINGSNPQGLVWSKQITK